MLWLYLIIFVLSCLALVRSSVLVIKALIRISKALGLSEFFITFCLMAAATSLPELFIGLNAAFHKNPQLSFGNIIGANVVNLTLVVGMAVLLGSGLSIKKAAAQKDVFWTSLFAFFPVFLILDGVLSRVDGAILLAALIVYMSAFFKEKARTARSALSGQFEQSFTQVKVFFKDVAIFLVGAAVLILSAEGVVRSAKVFASLLEVPLFLVGVLIVAFGTTLPELVFGIKAATMGRKEMVLGNSMGSVVINSTLILGLVALISPLTVGSFSPYLIGILYTVFSAFVFLIVARSGETISRKEGIFLLLIYLSFVLVQVFAG